MLKKLVNLYNRLGNFNKFEIASERLGEYARKMQFELSTVKHLDSEDYLGINVRKYYNNLKK